MNETRKREKGRARERGREKNGTILRMPGFCSKKMFELKSK